MSKENGLIQIPSRYSVDETLKRLQAVFAEKGLKVFEADEGADFRRPEGRYSFDGGCP